jgi:hypothetical protein
MPFQPIIERLLAKQPEQRYTIAEQFVQAIEIAKQDYWRHHSMGTVPMPIVSDEATRTLQVTAQPTCLDNDPDATRPQARPVVTARDHTAERPTQVFTAPSTATVEPTPPPPKAQPRPSRPRRGLWATLVVFILVVGIGSGLYRWLQQPAATPTPERIGPTVQLLPDPVDETPVTVTPVEPAPMQPPIAVAPTIPESAAAELARLPEIAPIPTLDATADQEPERDSSPPADLPGIDTSTDEQTSAVPIAPVEPPIIGNDDALDPLRAAIEQGDYVMSLALLDQQIADQPANRLLRDLRQQIQVQVILEQVSELRRDNRLQPALTAINQGLREFPDEPSLRVVAQEIRTALADQRNRIHADDHLQRARALYQQGQLESALQEVEQGLEYLPRHAELRILRARITVDQTYAD